jgi:hypothetical protein
MKHAESSDKSVSLHASGAPRPFGAITYVVCPFDYVGIVRVKSAGNSERACLSTEKGEIDLLNREGCREARLTMNGVATAPGIKPSWMDVSLSEERIGASASNGWAKAG